MLHSVSNRGGEIGAANGLSLARGALRVTITASGVGWNAALTSDNSVGVPGIC